MSRGRRSYTLEEEADQTDQSSDWGDWEMDTSEAPALTFTGAALTDEPHHQRRAAVTLGGRVEGLHHELMCFGLQQRQRSAFTHRAADLWARVIQQWLTFGEERPILPYPPWRMVGVWAARGGWSISCRGNTHRVRTKSSREQTRFKPLQMTFKDHTNVWRFLYLDLKPSFLPTGTFVYTVNNSRSCCSPLIGLFTFLHNCSRGNGG